MKNGWMLRSQNKGKNGPTLPKTACVYTVRRMSHRFVNRVRIKSRASNAPSVLIMTELRRSSKTAPWLLRSER
jgi:hypothetical protein